MARTIVGTHHFDTRDAAIKYYAKQGTDAAQVDYKLEQGEIEIGPPKLDFHCSDPTVPLHRFHQMIVGCWVDADGRYMLETR